MTRRAVPDLQFPPPPPPQPSLRGTATPHIGLLKPAIYGDDDLWGQQLNQNCDTLDALLGAGPFLPLVGGAVTGPVSVKTAPAGVSLPPQSLNVETIFTNMLAPGPIYGSRNYGEVHGVNQAEIWLAINRAFFSADAASTQGVVAGYDQLNRMNVAPGTFCWARCIEYRDQTGVGSKAGGGGQTCEFDWFGNGPDDMTAQNGRTIAPFVIALHDPNGADLEVGYAITFNAGPRCSFKNCVSARVPFSQSVLSTRSATQQAGGNAIWFRDGHTWSLNTAASSTLRYDTALGLAHLTGGLQVDGALNLLGDVSLAEGKHLWLNAAHTSYLYYDPTELGVGGARLAGDLKVDGDAYLLRGLTVAGLCYLAGGLSVQGDISLADGNHIWLNAAHTSYLYFDAAALAGAGGAHIVGGLEADGTVYFPNTVTVGGLAYFGTTVNCHTDLNVGGSAAVTGTATFAVGNVTGAGIHYTGLGSSGVNAIGLTWSDHVEAWVDGTHIGTLAFTGAKPTFAEIAAGAWDPTTIPAGAVGFYAVTNQSGAANWPADNPEQAACIVAGYSSNPAWQTQLMMGGRTHGGGPAIWFRAYSDEYGGNWSQWYRLFSTAGGTLAGPLTVTGAAALSGTLAVTGNTNLGRFAPSLSLNLTAAGTTLGTAAVLPSTNNVVATVGAGTGVALNPLMLGETTTVFNRGANPVNVYPQAGSVAIDGLAGGAPYVLAAGAARRFLLTDGVHWLSS